MSTTQAVIVVEVKISIVLGATFSVNISYNSTSRYFLTMVTLVVFVGDIIGN